MQRYRLPAAAAILALFSTPTLAQRVGIVELDLNMRAGPSTRFPVVATIPGDARVDIYGCTTGYEWCDVEWRGNRGWVFADYVNYRYRERIVPIVEFGSRVDLPIINFTFGSYWDNHYRNRPWYDRRDRWRVIWRDSDRDRGGNDGEGRRVRDDWRDRGGRVVDRSDDDDDRNRNRNRNRGARDRDDDDRREGREAGRDDDDRREGRRAGRDDDDRREGRQAGRDGGERSEGRQAGRDSDNRGRVRGTQDGGANTGEQRGRRVTGGANASAQGGTSNPGSAAQGSASGQSTGNAGGATGGSDGNAAAGASGGGSAGGGAGSGN